MNLINKGFLLVLLLVLCFSSVLVAQEPSESKTLEYINKLLGGRCYLERTKKTIVATYFGQNFKPIREDSFQLDDLNFGKAGYEPKEKVYFIPCLTVTEEGCVFRKMFITGNYRYYDRISFVIDGKDETIKKLTEAFKHLERIINEPSYKGKINLD